MCIATINNGSSWSVTGNVLASRIVDRFNSEVIICSTVDINGVIIIRSVECGLNCQVWVLNCTGICIRARWTDINLGQIHDLGSIGIRAAVKVITKHNGAAISVQFNSIRICHTITPVSYLTILGLNKN